MTPKVTNARPGPARPAVKGDGLRRFWLMARPTAAAEVLATALQGMVLQPTRKAKRDDKADDARRDSEPRLNPAFGGCDLLERYDYLPGRPSTYRLADEGVLPHGRC